MNEAGELGKFELTAEAFQASGRKKLNHELPDAFTLAYLLLAGHSWPASAADLRLKVSVTLPCCGGTLREGTRDPNSDWTAPAWEWLCNGCQKVYSESSATAIGYEATLTTNQGSSKDFEAWLLAISDELASGADPLGHQLRVAEAVSFIHDFFAMLEKL